MTEISDDARLAQVWDQFCDQLKAAKDVVFRKTAPSAAIDRAAGLRMLSRNIATALDKICENADPLHPELTHSNDWRRKFGGDNPDGIIHSAPLNGIDTFRISGTLGSAAFTAFTIKESGGTPHGGPTIASMFGHTMHVEPDGSFEIFLSPEPPEPRPKNWLQTTPKTYNLTIRQYFADWENEQLMEMYIDRLGTAVPPPDITVESISEGLLHSAQWLDDVAAYWADMIEKWQKRPMEFLSFRQMTSNSISATPGGEPLLCYWECAADEALVIRVIPPRATFWNFEFGNWWFESMDYRYRLASTNSHYAELEDDGELILVVSHDDPGLPNWLDASGFSAGYLACRWIGAESAPQPGIKCVPRVDLFKHLPPSVKKIDSVRRQEQLAARRRGVMRRFAGY